MRNRKKLPNWLQCTAFLVFSPLVWLWALWDDGLWGKDGMLQAIKETPEMWGKYRRGELP